MHEWRKVSNMLGWLTKLCYDNNRNYRNVMLFTHSINQSLAHCFTAEYYIKRT